MSNTNWHMLRHLLDIHYPVQLAIVWHIDSATMHCDSKTHKGGLKCDPLWRKIAALSDVIQRKSLPLSLLIVGKHFGPNSMLWTLNIKTERNDSEYKIHRRRSRCVLFSYYTDRQYACSDSLFPTSPTFRLSFVSSACPMFGGQNSQKLQNQSKIFCLSGEPIRVMDWRILLCSGVEQIWTQTVFSQLLAKPDSVFVYR